MSINSMLSIGKDALIMNQYALSIVSDNIANINVEGYARQRVEEETIGCDIMVKGGYGLKLTSMGARIADIKRFSNSLLDGQLRDAGGDNAYYTELQDAANVIENLLNELDGSSGLNAAFNEFYNALNDMASNPADLATRAVVVQKAENITLKFNQYANTLNTERKTQIGSYDSPESVYNSVASSRVSAINDLLGAIQNVNLNIAKFSTSATSSSALIDQRTSLLQELATYIPIEVNENQANGTCNVSFNGTVLVSGGVQKQSLAIQATGDANNPAKIVLVDNEGNETDITSDIKSGSLGASIELGSATSSVLSYAYVLDKLDTLAAEFAKAFNDIQTYTNTADGKAALSITLDSNGNKILKNASVDGSGNLVSPNDKLFETSDGSSTITASNITFSSAIASDPYGIAAAIGDVDTSTGVVENNLAVGDTQALLDMLTLRNKGFLNLNGNTFDGFLTSMVNDIGVKTSTVNSYADSADSSLNQLLETKTSLGGVNLDEELVDLIKYQRAYEASARVFNVASEVMKTMVNLGQ